MQRLLYSLAAVTLMLCTSFVFALEQSENQDSVSNLLDSLSNQDESENSDDFISFPYAKMIILNKITAKSEQIVIPIENEKFFGNISIKVDKCIRKKNTSDRVELMLIKVTDHKIDDDQHELFYGWMIPSRPSLSTLEHPVYEIIPKECSEKN